MKLPCRFGRRAAGSALAAALFAYSPAGPSTTATTGVPGSPLEHTARLQPFLGAYATVMEYGEQESRGTTEVRPVLGAAYVEWNVTSTGGGWHLRFPITWDAEAGRSRTWRFDTRGPQPPGENEGVARFEGDALVMKWSIPAPDGRPATFRNRVQMASDETFVMATEREFEDGENVHLVQTTGHRLDDKVRGMAGEGTGEAMTNLTTAEVLLRPSLPPDHLIAYGTADHAFGHLRLPEGAGPHSVAVLVHGGCWRSFASLRHFGSFASALTERGLANWNVNYRKVDEVGGGWPGTFLDVAASLDHLRELATRHNLEGLILGDEGACGMKVIEALVGGPPDEVPARYAAASPTHLLPLGIPQLNLVGEEDPMRSFVEAFASRARTAGDEVTLEILAGAGHHDLIAPWSSWWSTVPDLILGFYPGGPPGP